MVTYYKTTDLERAEIAIETDQDFAVFVPMENAGVIEFGDNRLNLELNEFARFIKTFFPKDEWDEFRNVCRQALLEDDISFSQMRTIWEAEYGKLIFVPSMVDGEWVNLESRNYETREAKS